MLGTVVAVPALGAARSPVSRARVARFAWRQQLEITPDNGNQVIAYLATTRRWRVAGLLIAYGLGLAWVLERGEGDVSLLQLLAGWFAGAVVAEARLARRPAGPRRAADDAIRSRSLHVLAGAGIALILYAVIHQVHALRPAWPAADAELQGATLLLSLGAPVLGWLVATTRWSVHRPALEPG